MEAHVCRGRRGKFPLMRPACRFPCRQRELRGRAAVERRSSVMAPDNALRPRGSCGHSTGIRKRSRLPRRRSFRFRRCGEATNPERRPFRANEGRPARGIPETPFRFGAWARSGYRSAFGGSPCGGAGCREGRRSFPRRSRRPADRGVAVRNHVCGNVSGKARAKNRITRDLPFGPERPP